MMTHRLLDIEHNSRNGFASEKKSLVFLKQAKLLHTNPVTIFKDYDWTGTSIL
jgi:hypothetical protein